MIFSRPSFSFGISTSSTMQTEQYVKKDLLYKFSRCLQQCLSICPNTSLPQRKRAIKLSSDISMAFARSGSAWSRALVIQHLCKQKSSDINLQKLMGNEELEKIVQDYSSAPLNSKITASRMIIRKSRSLIHLKVRRTSNLPRKIKAESLAKLIQNRRARVAMLKALVPGGGTMDELTLLGETADYICALRDQIGVMKFLVDALGQPSKCE